MSGLSSASSSTAGSPTQYGTNVPPVSFPGIASGIDYNSIIQKYTDLTLQQETPLKNKVTALNDQQAELLKIQDLISKFQDTFQAVSDPAAFNATAPTSSNSGAIGASSVANAVATPGTYVITKATLATATQLTNDPAANGTFDPTKPLVNAGASITPNNGPAGSTHGTVTIDGVALQYDVNTTDLQSWITNIANPALAAAGVGAALSYSNGKVTVTSTQPLTLGSANDSGNLLQVLKLDTAQVSFSGGVYTATSTTNIGGINVGATLNTAGNAGFATAVTAGNFTINGVVFKVDPTVNNLNDVIQQINSSSAGVIASYDAAGDRIILTSKTSGPQGISLGQSGDTSNFLQAAGFLTNYTNPNQISAGAQLQVGKSAHVQYTDNGGTAHDVYSNSNDVTNAIPGVDLKLQQAVDGVVVPPVTISVSQDSSGLQTAIKTFVAAYNAVIDEINTATQAPVVGSTTDATSGKTSGTQLTSGGVLFNNQDVLSLRDQLVNFVSGFGNTGSSSYNSLSSIGLVLDSSFTVQSASSSNAQNTTSQDNVSTQTFAGTSGRLQDLDVSKFTAALAANSSAVAKLFTGTGSIIGQLGAYLTTVSGLPTQLTGALAGKIPAQPLFTVLSSSTNDQITSLQQQIQLVTDQANMQADRLRQEFVSAESTIASLQSMQSSLGALTGGAKSSG
ncbi:MAG TPA: flagellar filament capping protein FliD [Candidatus Limnocylindrales bacterium]|nr:flagellar filament capping protein FliD [Candidatus Limnocylindrales bacterium]